MEKFSFDRTFPILKIRYTLPQQYAGFPRPELKSYGKKKKKKSRLILSFGDRKDDENLFWKNNTADKIKEFST